jgi:16S rRNA (uracil1498-N3)-methyltransferase
MTIRIYQTVSLTLHQILQLDDQASHHLARVLRVNVGDSVVVFNGQGGEYNAIIERIDKKSVTVQLLEFSAREAESPLEICLAQGISRGEKMDYTIQKAVELGVTQIMPLFTERCTVKLDLPRSEKRLAHWQSIAMSACEQSGRNRIPHILAPQSLNTWTPKADYCFVLSPLAANKLKAYSVTNPTKVILLIGPEGGLSEREINGVIEQGFLPLSLGPRILRTETAAVAAITALQCYLGDMLL